MKMDQPTYVIYYTDSTITLKDKYHISDLRYCKESSARAVLTRHLKKHPEDAGKLDIAEACFFHECIEKTKKVRNMLNPNSKEIEISVNTPACCDPSTETYHSL